MGLRQDLESLELLCNRLFFEPLAITIGALPSVDAIDATVDYWVNNGYAQWIVTARIIVEDQEIRDIFEEMLDNDTYFQAFLTKAETL